MGLLLIRAAFRVKRACGKRGSKRRYESLSSAKTPLLMIVLINTFTLPLQLISQPKSQALCEYLARLLFYSAALMLASPGCFINVRRVLRLLLMAIVAAGSGFSTVFVSTRLAGFSLPREIYALFALLFTADVLMIGSSIRKHKRAASAGRACAGLFTPYCDRAEISDKRKLDSALARNYMEEYSERFANQPFAIREIAIIQEELVKIRMEKLALESGGGKGGPDRLRAVEETAAELLGKLSVRYGFSTGFDDCYLDALCGGRSA